jgi:hypothetical protein
MASQSSFQNKLKCMRTLSRQKYSGPRLKLTERSGLSLGYQGANSLRYSPPIIAIPFVE